MRKCEYCGKEFKAFSPDYCSRECYERNVLEKWGCADKIAESGGNIMSEEIWERIYDKGKQKDIEKRLEIAYERKNWHELHIALWVWLSLDGEREKEEWFEMFNVPEVSNYCFPCEVAKIGAGCVNCPIQRLEKNDWSKCANGLYEKWVRTHKVAEREKLAREIATMKWEEICRTNREELL